MEEFEINDFHFMGYVGFYLAVYSDEKATMMKYESDFRKPITEEFVQDLVKCVINYYNTKFNMHVTKIQFVSREVYETYCKQYPKKDTDVEMIWKDEKCFVNGVEVIS